jgi:flagellar basal-body rod protein FlgC
MSGFGDSLAVSASGMEAQARRLRVVSENIANADTPGYRRKQVSFESRHDSASNEGRVSAEKLSLDRSPLPRVYDPTNPMADGTGYFDGSNVNIIIEMADAREAQRSYEANLRMFEQTRQMSQGLLDLLRR